VCDALAALFFRRLARYALGRPSFLTPATIKGDECDYFLLPAY